MTAQRARQSADVVITMANVAVNRSQAILRMPVEMVDAGMILHDGERSEVLVFVPPSEDLSHRLTDVQPFIPVMRNAKMCLIARSAIACFTVATSRAPRLPEELPLHHQAVQIALRSGVVIEGTLRWIVESDYQRLTDHLNSDAPYVVVRDGDSAHIVVKSHIATVMEV